MLDKLIELVKWISTLNSKQVNTVIVTVIFILFGYYYYITTQDKNQLYDRIDALTRRCAVNDSISQAALDACNNEMLRRVEEALEKANQRVDKLEERATINKDNIKQLK
jgi:hypothetical protein